MIGIICYLCQMYFLKDAIQQQKMYKYIKSNTKSYQITEIIHITNSTNTTHSYPVREWHGPCLVQCASIACKGETEREEKNTYTITHNTQRLEQQSIIMRAFVSPVREQFHE